MRNKVLAIYRNTVPYVKQFRKYVGSIAGCILFQQLDHWFESKPDGFYKFLEKPESDHPQYKDGDSWNEELGITPDEFRTAFDAIGVRYKSKKDYDLASDKFQGKFYCSYYDRVARLTWYFRNDNLVDKFLDLIMEGKDATELLETGIASSGDEGSQLLETGIASSRNGNCPVLETGIASSNQYTYLTTDLTTNIRADEFFAIAPSSQIQKKSLSAQNSDQDLRPPNPQSPLPPAASEIDLKEVLVDPFIRKMELKQREKAVEPWLKDEEFLNYLIPLLKRSEYYKSGCSISDVKAHVRKVYNHAIADCDQKYEQLRDRHDEYLKAKEAAQAIATQSTQHQQQPDRQATEDRVLMTKEEQAELHRKALEFVRRRNAPQFDLTA